MARIRVYDQGYNETLHLLVYLFLLFLPFLPLLLSAFRFPVQSLLSSYLSSFPFPHSFKHYLFAISTPLCLP